MIVHRILLVTLILSIPAVAQAQSTEVPKKFKCYTQYGSLPKGFKDLMEICIILPDGKDVSQIIGQLGTTRYVRGTNDFLVYEFGEARFTLQDDKRAKLSFMTVTKGGVRYRFIGELIKETETDSASNYRHLQGTLTKLKNGLKVSEAKFSLSPGIQE